jgi:Ca-activated chloride channel family protein
MGSIGESYGAAGIGAMGAGSGGGAMGTSVGSRQRLSEHDRYAMLGQSSESYRNYGVNPFTTAAEDHLSTFAIDVDTASYAIARRKIVEGSRPPADSVRVEEFVNYFRYDYPSPAAGPIGVELDAAPSPYDPGRVLMRVGLQGRKLAMSERKNAHLVFLVDISGSMQSPDKLPLAKRALRILVDNLRDGDTVGLVTYAGGVKTALQPTGLDHKAQIHEAIDALDAGGSTAMASGIELAYTMAARTLAPDSDSRVIVLRMATRTSAQRARKRFMRSSRATSRKVSRSPSSASAWATIATTSWSSWPTKGMGTTPTATP